MASVKKLGVAYCRVSTDLEEQKKSIIEQQRQWIEFFSQTGAKSAEVGLLCHREIKNIRADGKVTKGRLVTEQRKDGLYVDEGISGKSLQNRKAFQQMIEDAKLHKFDMIYVEDVSRFSRSMEDGYTIVKDLRDIGVGVYFRKEGWSSLDLSKDFELQLRLGIAQEENRAKSARVKWAIGRIQQRGGWSSQPPYGYDKVNGYLQINPIESEYVRMVFHWFNNEHWGQGKIARALNNIEAPTKRGGKWRDRQIQKMLKNPIYKGTQITHRVESLDITRHTQKIVDPSDWVVTQNEDLRIISDDMFEMTQIIYDQHSKMYSRGARQSSEQLLSGILYCAHCGSCFSRKKRNHHVKKDGTITDKGYVWACHIRDVYGTKGGCSGERIQVIEADCIEALKFEIKELKESNLDSFFKLYLQNKFKDIQKVNKSALEKKCNALNGELRLLLQAKRDGLLDDDLYTEQMKALNKEISEVKTTLSRLERITEEREHLLRLYKEYKETVQKIDVDNLTNADLKTIFYKIFVSYRKTAEGKKVPTLRFVYRFLDSTNDDILLGSAVNLHIYTNLYRYKEADSLEAD